MTLTIISAPLAAHSSDLVITGVIDGPLTGGLPKAVEFYVINDITDLSIYGFGSANNGGGADGEEFTFPADAAPAGSFLYVATEEADFIAFFGFSPDYTDSTAASINGNDTAGSPFPLGAYSPEGVISSCGDPATLIHEIQGTGLSSPLAGKAVSIEGVVVGDFQNNGIPDIGDLNGFFCAGGGY